VRAQEFSVIIDQIEKGFTKLIIWQMLNRLRSQVLLKRRLWVSPFKVLATIAINAASGLGSQSVEDVDTKMLKPDQTKDIKADEVHRDWCAANYSPYGECDCEDKNE